jgi:hypothetical protein
MPRRHNRASTPKASGLYGDLRPTVDAELRCNILPSMRREVVLKLMHTALSSFCQMVHKCHTHLDLRKFVLPNGARAPHPSGPGRSSFCQMVHQRHSVRTWRELVSPNVPLACICRAAMAFNAKPGAGFPGPGSIQKVPSRSVVCQRTDCSQASAF